MTPPAQANERRRLEVLWDHHLLDTPADHDLDLLTALAAQICSAPMAMISLVDEHRQWFKSRVGIEATQTDRELSFCTQAIQGEAPLIVADALEDPRFASSPLVQDTLRARAYLGVPLVSPEQQNLGTLCVMDRKPRQFTDTQVESMRRLAIIVGSRLEQHRQLHRAEVETQQTVTLARTVVELQTEVVRRRRAEDESRRFADIVHNIQVGLVVWRLEESGNPASFRLVTVNPAASVAGGLPMEPLIGKRLEEIYPRLAGADLPRRLMEVATTGLSVDLGLVTYEDDRIPRRDYRMRAFALPEQCVGVAFENVTDQRLLEQAQLENQARKAAILDSAPDAIVTIDFEGRVFEWNPAAERVFGHRRAAVLGKELAVLVFSSTSRDRFRSALSTYIRTGHGTLLGRRLEMSARRSDGTEFPVEMSVSRVAREGAPIFTGFIRDITERKRFEEALRASQGLYSSLVESLPQNVFRKDLEQRFTFSNTKFCSTVGRRLEEVIGRNDFDFFPPAEAVRLRDQDRKVIQTGDTLESVEEMELPGMGRRHVQLIKAPICNSVGSVVGLQGMFWDITERVQLEDQLRQAQKMETVGQLAGGVAHDFNNLLTVIQGHASMLLSLTSLKPNENAALQNISAAAERAAHLTRQLLTFSRKQMLQPVVLDLNQLIQHLLEMVRRSIGEAITLQTSLDPLLPPVEVDPVMIEQVLLNLAANARDAMPNGGRLAITTRSVTLTPDEAAQQPDAKPGTWTQLSVGDTGTGIAPEHIPHLFEPFFTTKEVGKGTGLGLATVYGIVKQHRGWIALDSEIGRGTAFHIFLPASTLQTTAIAKPDESEPLRGGRETILVVEDEPALRSLVRGILEHNGYTILEAATGREALDLWTQHHEQIDLLLTDMIMPDGVNGRDLALQLQAGRPSLQVLYTSGYSTEVVGANFPLEEGINFLPKPYAPRKLVDTVRRSLDRATQRPAP